MKDEKQQQQWQLMASKSFNGSSITGHFAGFGSSAVCLRVLATHEQIGVFSPLRHEKIEQFPTLVEKNLSISIWHIGILSYMPSGTLSGSFWQSGGAHWLKSGAQSFFDKGHDTFWLNQFCMWTQPESIVSYSTLDINHQISPPDLRRTLQDSTYQQLG